MEINHSRWRPDLKACISHNYALIFGFVSTLDTDQSHHLLRYIVFLTRTLAASGIPCYLNVVRILHPQCGFPNPPQEMPFKFQKDLLTRGIKRPHGDVVHQKLPITPDILHKLHGKLDLPVSSPSSHFFGSLIYLSRPRARLILTNTCACVIFAYVHEACFSSCAGPRRSSIVIAPY